MSVKRPFLVILAIFLPWAVAAQTIAEPDDYRQEDYRSAVPSTLSGGTVVDTEEAERLWRERKAIFIDVLPRPEKPANLPQGTFWRSPTRLDIPGSIWLPNVGYGSLAPAIEDYFRTHLETIADGDVGRAMVFYCLADCWMSWNAAKRAIEWGYEKVIWYPDGTDGWVFDDLPLEKREPESLPDAATP